MGVAMKRGEQAIVTCTNLTLLSDEKLGLKEVSGEKILLTLRLIEFEKGKDHYSMNEEEKVGFGTSRKEMGSTLFKRGRTALALERYKKVAEMFSYIDSMKDETMKIKAKDLKRLCELNKAACFLKLKEYAEAKKACETVLKDEPNNVKAMFRKAQACYEMKDIHDCMRDLKRLIEIDAQKKKTIRSQKACSQTCARHLAKAPSQSHTKRKNPAVMMACQIMMNHCQCQVKQMVQVRSLLSRPTVTKKRMPGILGMSPVSPRLKVVKKWMIAVEGMSPKVQTNKNLRTTLRWRD